LVTAPLTTLIHTKQFGGSSWHIGALHPIRVLVARPETFGLHNREQKEVSFIAGLNTGGYNGHIAKLFSNTQLQLKEMTP